MFPLCPPECNVTPLPLVGVCTPPRLHGLLRSTLEACASSKTYGAQPRTNFIFFDSDQVLASPDILSPSRRSSGIPVSASGASPAFYGGFVPAFVRGPFRAQPGLFASPRSSGQTHANSQCGIQSAVFSPPGHLPFHKEEEAPRPSEADGGRAQSTGHPGENFYPPHTLSDGAGSVGKEGAPSSFPASSSATSGPSGKGDAGGGTGESGGGPLAWASSPVGTMSGHASSSVFTAEATLSSLRRAPPGKKKTTVAPEHHLNKGLLRHGWMRKQLTDRPAAYILCFDWREAFSEHPPLAAPPSASSTTALSEPERSTDPWLREQASSCLSSARSCSPVCPASLRRVTSDMAAHSSASSAGPTRSSQSVSGSASSCCPCCPHAGAASRSTGRAAVCDPDAGPSQTQAQERRNGQQGRSHSRDAIRGDVPVPHVSGWPPQENSENFPHCPPGSRLCCRQGFCPKEQKSYGATAEGGRASSGTTTTTAGLGTPLDLEPGGESQRDVGTTMPVLSSPGGGGTRQGISREPAQEEDAGRPVSPWGTEKQGEGTGQSVEGPLAGRGAGLTSGARELAVARAEHAALALIECVRERLHRKKVAPKMVLFVILPVGLSDPQGAVNCLRRLNPSEIAALFVTCGIDDIQTKMERLEQVAHDCGIEHYENESRRYRKQIQHAPKAGADRAQSSASHVFQARNLVKAGYVLEFAGQPHAAMKSFIAAWQLLTTDKQMASAVERMALCNLLSVRMYHMYFQASEPGKAAHHAREHRAVLRENAPEDEEQLLGYLLPQWLAELHQLLGQLLEESSRMQQQQLQLLHTHNQGSTVQSGAGNSGTLGGRGGRAEIGEGMGGMAVPHSFSPTSDAWQNPGFHFQAAARYLQELRLWIRRAKVQLQPPSMKGGLNVQSEWIGQLDTLQHGVEPFSSVTANLHPGTAAVMMRQEVILRWIFSVSEQQVATHATHLLSKAHAVYKMIGGSRHCPVIACQLADALFDSQRMLTARQLYATLAQALSANIYGVGSPPSLLASLTSPGTSPHIAGGRDPSPFRSSVAPSTLVDRHDSSSHSALGTRGAGERWPKEGSSVGRAEAGILPSSATPGLAVLRMPQKEKEMPNSEARGHENFPGLFMDTGGNESDGQGGGLSFWAMKNAGWSPLLFYVLARLLLCVCSLLSVPPPPVLYDLARVNPLLHTFEARRVSSFRAPFRTAGSSSLPRSEGASHSENHVSPWAPLSEPSSSLPPYSSGGVMESHDAPSERLGLPCSMEQTPLVVAEAEGEQDGGTQGNDSISNTPIRTLGPLSALAAEEASGREESVPREESRMPGALPSLLDVENYRIGLLAVFQLFNLLALRRREDDPTLRKRQQLYEFIVFGLVPNLRRFVGENTGAERIETPAVVGRQDCVASSERAQGEGREKSRTDSPSERRDRTEKGLVRGRKVESKGIRESDCGDGKEGNKTQQVIAEISLPSVVGWVRFPSVDELRVTEEAGRVGTSGGRRQEYHSGNLSDGAFSPAQETEQQQRDKKEERAFGEAKPKHINKSRLAVEGVVCLEQNFGVDLTLRCFGVLRTTRGVMACQLIPLSPLRSVLTGFGVDKAGERRTAPEREKHTVSSWRPDGQQDSAGGETAAAEACTLVSGTPSWFRLLVSPGEAVLSLFASFSSHPVPSRVVSLSLAWHDCPAVSFCLSTLLPLDPLHPPPKISQPLSWLNHGRLEKNNCAQPPASSQNADSFKFSRTCDPAPPDVQGEIEGQVTVFRSNQDFHCLSSSYSPSGRLFRSRTLSSFVRLQEKVCFHGCWPDPVQKALLQRQLAVPPPPLPVCSQEFAAASSVHLFLPNHKVEIFLKEAACFVEK
ncbi:hypothetical protein CSUI_010331 [Cystoisospora suis]|uniref:Trafficking protein particle complex subunit 11 domain-containing protein n=1 Tax=Cystoisospora suis TaxID=483139 RepID=A0A2C6KH40_9APIC|nr:hypothetical protein CSUI_010331 [Cystoisospora suis]